MELKAKIQEDMKLAMRARDSLRLGALRMLVAEIKKREIDSRAELATADIQKVISSLLKQRADSIEAFRKANRTDLVEKEEQEAAVLKAYMPEPLSEAELASLVDQAIAETGASKPADIGLVMKAVLAKAAGRADGKAVNALARAKLSGS